MCPGSICISNTLRDSLMPCEDGLIAVHGLTCTYQDTTNCREGLDGVQLDLYLDSNICYCFSMPTITTVGDLLK